MTFARPKVTLGGPKGLFGDQKDFWGTKMTFGEHK